MANPNSAACCVPCPDSGGIVSAVPYDTHTRTHPETRKNNSHQPNSLTVTGFPSLRVSMR